jgi:hypothetical protein
MASYPNALIQTLELILGICTLTFFAAKYNIFYARHLYPSTILLGCKYVPEFSLNNVVTVHHNIHIYFINFGEMK